MTILKGISDETLAAMAESGHPVKGADNASRVINDILFESTDDIEPGETYPEAINVATVQEKK